MRAVLIALAIAAASPVAAQGFTTVRVVPVIPHASGIQEASPAPWYQSSYSVPARIIRIPNAKVIELFEEVGPTPCGQAFESVSGNSRGCVANPAAER